MTVHKAPAPCSIEWDNDAKTIEIRLFDKVFRGNRTSLFGAIPPLPHTDAMLLLEPSTTTNDVFKSNNIVVLADDSDHPEVFHALIFPTGGFLMARINDLTTSGKHFGAVAYCEGVWTANGHR